MIISSGGNFGGLHQDCNGKTPLSQLLQPPPRHQAEHTGGSNPQSHLMADVFPQVNARSKDREDLDDDIEYVGYCRAPEEIRFNCIRIRCASERNKAIMQ